MSSIDTMHPQSKRNNGRTSHQHQVPDLTTQGDTPHHIPLDNWDIAPTPLPRYNKCNKSTSINSCTSGTSNIYPPRAPGHPNSKFKLQYTEDTHLLCTVYGPLTHCECPNPPNLSLVNIAVYTTTITIAQHIRRYIDTYHMPAIMIHSFTTIICSLFIF